MTKENQFDPVLGTALRMLPEAGQQDSAAAEINAQALRIFEYFLTVLDQDALFSGADAGSLRDLRQEVAAALHRLLVWERPWLEAQRGILWPYQALAERYHQLQPLADDGSDPFRQVQAQLLLAMLPFPRQWQWLARVAQRFDSLPELRAFGAAETGSITEKIEHKPQKTYKLRHFCQVLKSYRSVREKGILRIFSIPYLLATHPRMLSDISKRYVVFAEPPMGIVFRHTWWRHFTNLEDPCVIGIGSPEDQGFLRQQTSIEVVPLAHGDFLQDLELPATSPSRDYDIVFNATFDDIRRKRHQLMLELLRHPLLARVKALFLGRGSEANVAVFSRLVEQSGLGERVTIVPNVRRDMVPGYLARCRMGVHLSLYENACRSIYEFFRSDLPCVVSSSMAGMNPEIFSDETGRAVRDEDLPQAIAEVLEHPARFSPRRWFREHSGSRNSSRKLNAVFKTLFIRWGYEWHDDIVGLSSSGANRYAEASDYPRFRADFLWLLACLQQATAHPALFTME